MKQAIPLAVTEDSALIVEGGASAALVTILQTAVLRMIPYAVPGLALVLLDLMYGIRAAKARGEAVRLSTAIRRSLTKVFLYICWLILATTIALAFGKAWLEWGVLALVYANEGLSIVGNYLETKGIQFSIVAVYRAVIKWISGKAGVDVEPGEIISGKPNNQHKPEE